MLLGRLDKSITILRGSTPHFPQLFVVFIFLAIVNDYYSHVGILGIVGMVGIATMGCNTIVGSNPIPATKRML